MASRKKLFISLLAEDGRLSDYIGGTAAKYGIETAGVVWKEEPGKPVWGDVVSMILKKECHGWLVAGKLADWQSSAETRSHIALAALKTANLMGPSFGFFSMIEPNPEALPTPLSGAIEVEKAKLGAKLAAKLGMAAKAGPEPEYRLDVHPLPVGDGFVAEIGPAPGKTWAGALLAIRGGGEISHHTVGKRGDVPDRGIVEYAMKGLKLELGGKEYAGWAVANALDAETSYFVRITGEVEGMAFGELPSGDAGDLYAVGLA